MRSASLFDTSHYDRLGAAFDRFLPHIQPVTDAILARLPEVRAGTTVLDLACGTGEPGLSLLRRAPEARLLGVDAAEGMIAVARRKAEALANARFETMPLEALTLGDGSVDVAISRFGFLLFGDPAASARELARVLKPDGAFSVATWEETAANTFLSAVLDALGSQIAPEQMPRFDGFDALAVAGRRERWLHEAGLRRVESEPFRWNYTFTDLSATWDLVVSQDALANLVAPLSEAQRDEARRHLAARLAPHRGPEGSYGIPQTCRLFWGRR